jgi:nucleoside-diphosphate-sugar epimerase
MDPVQTAKNSVSGVINMLGLAKRPKVRILQASTSELYGDPNVHPQSEDYLGQWHSNCYLATMRASAALRLCSLNRLGPRAYDERI